jgi:hypothetical protein
MGAEASMIQNKHRLLLSGCVLVAAIGVAGARARATDVRSIFVIAMENHNWTQPANQFTGNIQQIYRNPNAPYLNSLVDGTSAVSDQVAYAAAYHNVLATATGANRHIHPSEPNYVWAEAGTNFGIANDNDPYGPNGTNQNTTQHLSAFLTKSGRSWRSYQEDTDLMTNAAGQLVNLPLAKSQWTVSLKSFSGSVAAGLNEFNFSPLYNYAAKHNPMLFFTDTNGGNDATPSNPLSAHYAPLQQLFVDLGDDRVADYNWITPNQFNDMHTTLSTGFEGLTGDAARIPQGDNFLAQVVPTIMASDAYRRNGLIVIWMDEAEGDGVAGDNPDDFNHTLPFVVISRDAHKNVNGVPYASPVNYWHSSFLRTMEEIFDLKPLLGDAANAADLSDLFKPGFLHEDHHDRRDR